MNPTSFSRYLPQGDRARDWQLWCTTAGRASVSAGQAYPPAGDHPPQYARTLRAGRVLDEYQLVYVTRGRGRLVASGAEEAVGEGDMILVFPGVRHSYAPDPATGWDEQWVGFRGPLADALVARGFFDAGRSVLHPGVRDDMVRDYGDLLEVARAERPGYQYELGALVYRLLARLAAGQERAEQHSRAEELATQARAWMEARVEGTLDVAELAGQLGLGYENFRRIFLRYTGLSPYKYFLQLKMARAQVLLESEGLSVKEAAARLSFENQYYFSRAFKTHTGRSPSAWVTSRVLKSL
jgi:AraC-like DNA-binding protein